VVDLSTGNWSCSCCNMKGDMIDFEILMAANKGETITRDVARLRVIAAITMQGRARA
jgi:hypothetical protein